jgi:putative Holliday junction resolvase
VRALALDLGSKRVGVALSDPTGVLASPLVTLHRTGDRRAEHEQIARIVAEEGVELVLVGDPINMDGSRGAAAAAAEEEAAQLAERLGVPVELVDERLTTVAADRALLARGRKAPQRRRVVDQVAATVLLQGWLDGRRRDPGLDGGQGGMG